MQAGDAVGWVRKADLEAHILIATSASYLLRFRITPFLPSDFDGLDTNTTLVRTTHQSAGCQCACASCVDVYTKQVHYDTCDSQ